MVASFIEGPPLVGRPLRRLAEAAVEHRIQRPGHRRADGSEGKEWERNTEFKYVVQSGPLKNVAVRLRNATFRSNFARDADEVRLLVSYSVALW